MHNTGRVFKSIATSFVYWLMLLCVVSHPAVSSEPPIKMGVTVSLSGEFAAPGRDMLQGIQMWVHDVNARGALLGRKVELVYYDDKSDPATSARLYEQLITGDQVDLLLGPYSSPLTLEASTVAERHDFPMLATGAAAGEIWSRGYRNIFGVDEPARSYMDIVMESAKNAGLNRIALVYGASKFPQEVAEGVREDAARLGMEIVFDREYPSDATDFSQLIQQMKRMAPEIVIGGTYFKDSVAFMRQAKQSQFSPKAFIFTVGPALEEFGEALGADAEGVMGVVAWMRSARLPKAQDFSYRYRQKFGANAGVHAAYGYGAAQVLEAAVRLAGSVEKDGIREQLQQMIFRSLLGAYRVDPSGKQIGKETYVMQWQDGHRRLVLPKNMREGVIYYPFKPWSER
jgi:branched-chain amino acid transport system substrate-binding protein